MVDMEIASTIIVRQFYNLFPIDNFAGFNVKLCELDLVLQYFYLREKFYELL